MFFFLPNSLSSTLKWHSKILCCFYKSQLRKKCLTKCTEQINNIPKKRRRNHKQVHSTAQRREWALSENIKELWVSEYCRREITTGEISWWSSFILCWTNERTRYRYLILYHQKNEKKAWKRNRKLSKTAEKWKRLLFITFSHISTNWKHFIAQITQLSHLWMQRIFKHFV